MTITKYLGQTLAVRACALTILSFGVIISASAADNQLREEGMRGSRIAAPAQEPAQASTLTGALSTDLASMLPAQDDTQRKQIDVQNSLRKKPVVAGLLSLAVPGAGQVYTHSYVRAAVYFVAEVVGVAAGIAYGKKGDTKTDEFQAYADQHWSAVKYADFLNTYARKYRADDKNATIDLTASRDVLWSQINAYEEGPWKLGFSHKLPRYGEQQYYELIGKYDQFKYGWDTYPVVNGHPANDSAYDQDIPQQLLDYAAERGKANDFYSASRLAFSLVVVNHFLSAVDGYLAARHYNAGLSSDMSMERIGNRYVAVSRLTLTVGI